MGRGPRRVVDKSLSRLLMLDSVKARYHHHLHHFLSLSLYILFISIPVWCGTVVQPHRTWTRMASSFDGPFFNQHYTEVFQTKIEQGRSYIWAIHLFIFEGQFLLNKWNHNAFLAFFMPYTEFVSCMKESISEETKFIKVGKESIHDE